MRNFIDIIEGKQVGIIYHFTSMHSAWSIVEEDIMKPKEGGGISYDGNAFVIDRFRDWVSFTRNHNLIATPAAGGDGRSWGEVRIAFDGDRLSNRHSIRPYHDSDEYLTRADNQSEERIMGEVRGIRDAIIQIDFNAERYVADDNDFDNWVSPPDDPEKRSHYIEQSQEAAAFYVKKMRELGFTVNVVTDFSRPARR